MKKTLLLFLVLCMLFSICLIGCQNSDKPSDVVRPAVNNAFWNHDTTLYSFYLDGQNYTINQGLEDALIYNEYEHNSDDVSLLVKMGFSSGETPYVYYKASNDSVTSVYCRAENSYISVELRFKKVDGKIGNYNFHSLTENADFQWFGLPIAECTPDALQERVGEPTSVEKEDNGVISALIYKGDNGESLRIDFLGGKLWGIKFMHKI